MAHPDIAECTTIINSYLDRALHGDKLAARICIENARKRAGLLGWNLLKMHEREIEAAWRQERFEDYVPGCRKPGEGSGGGVAT